MLHCTMGTKLRPAQYLHLEDLLGNLQHARRTGDLGRLVHVTYWDVRKWARWTHRDALAARASDLIGEQPHPDRSAFLAIVDDVIKELERIHREGDEARRTHALPAIPTESMPSAIRWTDA